MDTATVARFTPRADRTAVDLFARQLLGTLDIMPLAYAIFVQDQIEKRLDRDLQFYPVPGTTVIEPDTRAAILDRAVTVMTLGDPAKRALMDDMAAMAILRGVLRGIDDGSIAKESPLARLDLSTAKQIAQLAVAGALTYAAGYPIRPTTTKGGGE